MKRNLLVLLVVAVLSAGCGMFKSLTAPSRDDAPPDIPPGATVYEVPLPGASSPFRWWISSITPDRNSQLVVGQNWSIKIACDAPDGYSFFMQKGFSSGPGTSILKHSSSTGGSTNGCSGGRSIAGPMGIVRLIDFPDDLPYYRFSVWVQAGGIGDLLPFPSRPPDIVVDEYIGWRRAVN